MEGTGDRSDRANAPASAGELLADVLRGRADVPLDDSVRVDRYTGMLAGLEKLANKGHAVACNDLGRLHWNCGTLKGSTLEGSYDKAFHYFSEAAKLGHPNWCLMAKLGHPNGCLMAGICYVEGFGVEQQKTVGLMLVQKAANMGSEAACVLMGTWLRDGMHGLPKDSPMAVYWYGMVPKENMGLYPEEDVPFIAKMLLEMEKPEKGSEGETKPSAHANKEEVKKVKRYTEMLAGLEKLAKRGHVVACNALGRLHWNCGTLKGSTLEGSYDKAFHYFSDAAKRGDPHGCLMAGMCYVEGFGVEQQKTAGLLLVQQASLMGSEAACVLMGTWLRDGMHGLPKDSFMAAYWYGMVPKANMGHYPEEDVPFIAKMLLMVERGWEGETKPAAHANKKEVKKEEEP